MPRLTEAQLAAMDVTVSKDSPTQIPSIKRPNCTFNAPISGEAYTGPEKELQAIVEQYLEAKGYPYLHIRKAKGNRKGWPDLTVLCPDGKTLYVELKVKGGRLAKEQKKFIIDAERLGHEVKICTSIESVIEAIRKSHDRVSKNRRTSDRSSR